MVSHIEEFANGDRHPISNVITRTLHAFAIDLMGIPNQEELFWYVARNVVGELNFVDCVIYAANEDQTELTQVAALGEKNPFGRNILNPLKIPFGEGVTGRVANNREAIIVQDLTQDGDYIPDTQPARSEICVPMVFRNRVVGVIDSEHPDADAFGAAELEILTTVAAMTSAKLELLEEAQRSNRRYHDLVASHAQLTKEISSRKSLETQLFEARKLEAIGQLAGGIAHDFNNLLTVISGNLEYIEFEMDGLNTAAKECLNDARAAADRAARLIHNMLVFSQKSRLNNQRVELNDIISSTAEFSQNLLPNVIDINLSLSHDPIEIFVDKAMVESVILNLILNARDAMKTGGEIKIKSHVVTVSGTDHSGLGAGKYAQVLVQDTGHGISPMELDQIFDPFFTTKGVGAGTGLGLSTVAGFMKQIKGAVFAKSVIGQGADFELLFPISTVGHDTF